MFRGQHPDGSPGHLQTICSHFSSLPPPAQKKHQQCKEKKEKAHAELQNYRAFIEKQEKAGKVFNDAETLEIEERKAYLEKLRDENDTIYFRREPMEFNQATTMLIKYQKLFKYLEKIDFNSRTKIGSIFKKGSTWALWPMRKSLEMTINNTISKNISEALEAASDLINEIPQTLENKVLAKMQINIQDHLPKEEEEFEDE